MSDSLINLELYNRIQDNTFSMWFKENCKDIAWKYVDFDLLFHNINSINDERLVFDNLNTLRSRLFDIVNINDCKKAYPVELQKWRGFVKLLDKLTISQKDSLIKAYQDMLDFIDCY